eukprot:CAMPEP_0177625052 /NCGR_PEP_ID=MMETSP0419_2-20121207/29867_1 /TAXON_ID=582737 /ORGANISM="Tetraselmis sp., Strain GSL018" /LENGTH=472 /DNA_ID=CAMNT_0019125919 /DNA_START=460 /DNA_END=1879 /DNA_ORIENTATION=+
MKGTNRDGGQGFSERSNIPTELSFGEVVSFVNVPEADREKTNQYPEEDTPEVDRSRSLEEALERLRSSTASRADKTIGDLEGIKNSAPKWDVASKNSSDKRVGTLFDSRTPYDPEKQNVESALSRFRQAVGRRQNGRRNTPDGARRVSESPALDAEVEDWGVSEVSDWDGASRSHRPGGRPGRGFRAPSSFADDSTDWARARTRVKEPHLDADGRLGSGRSERPDAPPPPPRTRPAASAGDAPRVSWLEPEDANSLIPAAPLPEQYSYYQGRNLVQSVGLSFVVGLAANAFTQAAPLAVGAASFPFLAPLLLATARNLPMRRFPYCGNARRGRRVAAGAPRQLRRQSRGPRAGPIGDSGARARLQLETAAPSSAVQPGDRVEAVVVANDLELNSFKVVRELFLPDAGIWLSEYPFINRQAFQYLSTDLKKAPPRGSDLEELSVRPYGVNGGSTLEGAQCSASAVRSGFACSL